MLIRPYRFGGDELCIKPFFAVRQAASELFTRPACRTPRGAHREYPFEDENLCRGLSLGAGNRFPTRSVRPISEDIVGQLLRPERDLLWCSLEKA